MEPRGRPRISGHESSMMARGGCAAGHAFWRLVRTRLALAALAFVVSLTVALIMSTQEALAAGSARAHIENTNNSGDFTWGGVARDFPRRSYERKLCVRVSGPGIERSKCKGFKATGTSFYVRGFCLVGYRYWATARVFDRRGRVLASDVDDMLCGKFNPGPAVQTQEDKSAVRPGDR